MPKLKPESTAPEILELEQNIESAEQAIAALNTKIQSQEKDAKDFEAAIATLDNKSKNVPNKGDFSGSELVKKLTEDIKSEKEKNERLSVLKQSLDITKASLQASQEELAEIESKLGILQDDLDWETYILHHCQKPGLLRISKAKTPNFWFTNPVSLTLLRMVQDIRKGILAPMLMSLNRHLKVNLQKNYP